MKVAVLFDRFGPYHIARLEAAAKYVTVIPIEVSGETSEYQWDKVESQVLKNRITLFAQKESTKIPAAQLMQTLAQELSKAKPDVVAVNGWYDRAALGALAWCLENKVPAVVMSESAAGDEQRIWWKEFIKHTLVGRFGAGLVGGSRHADYLHALGMPKENIFIGYDVVDNDYFEREADKARGQRSFWQQQKNLPENYFLIVSRFIQKKNLPFVIKAYHDYLRNANGQAWDLYLLGDGPLKPELLQLTEELGLRDKVHFEGFKQYDELPIYFGLARTFIHASTTEQWGLVVNEAMASGLPVVISERCNCVPELVHTGRNGYVIDPNNQPELTRIMTSLSNGQDNPEVMGQESRKIVTTLHADAFGRGLRDAAQVAHKAPRKGMGLLTRFLLKKLINR
ncbi:hexosyltransferase [Adhaeribacter aerolatus]|uniref:Hexosyltransferase n=1 Tax=Adhaeribacter aerolatus TaxID=670289 RepID=A0A512AW78_9BACT|nr:glycosyltransferase family 4 protein [Adhaeribacter aerolatus]GEO03930.1 hexosyltransferase [Adhaeribacter aerolatus]